MKISTWTLLLAALVALAVPAGAGARARDPFAKATLQAATGMLTIAETRCPAGTQAGSADCGHANLDAKFAAVKPRTRPAQGRTGFARGLRITGRGSGECSAESPTTVLTGPDGSTQLLSGAARVEPGAFDTSNVVIASNRRGVRVAWLEPLAPGLGCSYFDEPSTELALPPAQALPDALISPRIAPRVLKRSRFSVTIAGSQDWTEQAADGSQVAGHATWRLRLDYKR